MHDHDRDGAPHRPRTGGRAPPGHREAALNPSAGSVTPTRFEIRVERSLVLPGRVWSAERPRALIAIVHGLGEHCGRYAALASDFVRAGYTVASVDWPGHGEAPGPRGDLKSWVWFRDRVIPALLGAHLGMASQPERTRHILFGHSMGGAMALDYAIAHPGGLSAVVASAPALRISMPPWWKLALANVARVTAPSVGFPNGLDTTGISRDPEVMRLHDEDPMIHDKISPRLYADFTEARQRVLRDARRLSVPALVLHGGADRVVDIEGSKEFCAAAPAGRTRFVRVDDAYHEIFNDVGRDELVKGVVDWLGAVLR